MIYTGQDLGKPLDSNKNYNEKDFKNVSNINKAIEI